ncbi:hypothetical protein BC832DRAFT_592214 [Gaertneriomyces semiglobifer]|nr:hypothetical protein BC832DRAFT_592214 [Gaertneriomyces semiglobifer]
MPGTEPVDVDGVDSRMDTDWPISTPAQKSQSTYSSGMAKSDELASCNGAEVDTNDSFYIDRTSVPVHQNDGFCIDRTPVRATLIDALEVEWPEHKSSSENYLANAPRTRVAESKYDMSLPPQLHKPSYEWTSKDWKALKRHCKKKRIAKQEASKKRTREAIQEFKLKHYDACGTPLGTVSSEDIAALPELGRDEATNPRSYGTYDKPTGISGVSACRNRSERPSHYQIRKAFGLSGYDISTLPDGENVTSAEWFLTLPSPHRAQHVVDDEAAFFEDRKGNVQRSRQYHEMGWDNDIKGRRRRELLEHGNDTFQHKEDPDAGGAKQSRKKMAHSDTQVCEKKQEPVFTAHLPSKTHESQQD